MSHARVAVQEQEQGEFTSLPLTKLWPLPPFVKAAAKDVSAWT
jgi:hypothetical protein